MNCLESTTENEQGKGVRGTEARRLQRTLQIIYCGPQGTAEGKNLLCPLWCPLLHSRLPGSAFNEGSLMWSLSALAPLTPNASPHVQSWTSAFTQSLYVNHLHSMGQLLPQSRSPLPRLAFLTLVINGPARKYTLPQNCVLTPRLGQG